MAIKIIDNFECFVDHLGNFTSLIIKENLVEQQLEYCKAKNIKSISVQGWECRNINFISHFLFVENLYITNINTPLFLLNELKNLKHFRLGDCDHIDDIDYTNFTQLETLYADVNKKIPDLYFCEQLKEIGLWSLKTKTQNLEEVYFPTSVIELSLIQSNITTLKGLKLPNLEKLELAYCKNIEDISAIKIFKNTLKNLAIENCKKIKDYKLISECKKLGTLTILDSADMESLEFVKEIPDLGLNFYGTRVLDNDMTPLLSIRSYNFKNNKDYTHKLDKNYNLIKVNRN